VSEPEPGPQLEARIDRLLPLPDSKAHRLKAMNRTDNGRWYGSCTCGHNEQPAPDKDTAWEELGGHFTPMLERVALREQCRRVPGLLDVLEAAGSTRR
jgi:hypothetical protein